MAELGSPRELVWADDVDTDTDTLATISCSAAGKVLMWNGSLWGCSADTFAARSEELEEKVASLQKQLQHQKEELLAVVQSQQEQMVSQQEQIAQLQRMVEHQFAAR